MIIEMTNPTIREVAEGYKDSQIEGVYGLNGKLNIRPKYQREFVYKETQRNLVIDTIIKGFPLNVMYWCKNEDGTYEVLDGQQRTISFCQFINGDFSMEIDGMKKNFGNLTKSEQDAILDYKLSVYVCEGTDKEKLDWFNIINIAGVELTKQEIRNAVYTGEWLADAKRVFSKPNCAAENLSSKYVSGSAIRQELLEVALKWISKGQIEEYMSKHQHDQNANELWLYYRGVIEWVKLTFTEYRKEMKGVDWGYLYDNFHTQLFDTAELNQRIKDLMLDRDVTNNKRIFEYLLTGNERCLNIRAFDEIDKRAAYERQNGICAKCGEHFEFEEMEGDHITPWREGGKTTADNCQMLCKHCNRIKSDK